MQSFPRALVRVAVAAVMFALTACGGEETDDIPVALPLTDSSTSTIVDTVDSVSVSPTSSRPEPVTTSTSTPTTTTPTTTTTLPDPPVAPTLVVECATNPPTVTVSFDVAAGAAVDWEIRATRHPGGTGLDPIIAVLASGETIPGLAEVHHVQPNDLSFSVVVENAAGSDENSVGIKRYTGCPVSGSTEAVIVDSIDCVSGAFHFSGLDESDIDVRSVLIDRVSGFDTALAVRASGNYWVPDWTGPEEVKAVVTFTDPTGTHEEHINHWCFGGPFGRGLGADYEVCEDEVVRIAYPADWFSTVELDGPEGTSCSYFRFGAVDGVVDNNVTLRSLGSTTLAAAESTVLPVGPWVIADSATLPAGAYTDPVGATKGGARVSYDLAWTDDPTTVRRRVWLIDVDGDVWRLEANVHGLAVIDGMQASMQFVVQ